MSGLMVSDVEAMVSDAAFLTRFANARRSETTAAGIEATRRGLMSPGVRILDAITARAQELVRLEEAAASRLDAIELGRRLVRQEATRRGQLSPARARLGTHTPGTLGRFGTPPGSRPGGVSLERAEEVIVSNRGTMADLSLRLSSLEASFESAGTSFDATFHTAPASLSASVFGSPTLSPVRSRFDSPAPSPLRWHGRDDDGGGGGGTSFLVDGDGSVASSDSGWYSATGGGRSGLPWSMSPSPVRSQGGWRSWSASPAPPSAAARSGQQLSPDRSPPIRTGRLRRGTARLGRLREVTTSF